ncbi:MAG: serine hydrolase [Acidobacteria bacterium]|nr:serine hydrolase [Acidobacteriota bacterium]
MAASPLSRRVLIAALALPLALSAQPNLDQVAQNTLKTFEVPGVAVMVIKDGQIVVSKGCGVRKLGQPDPVTPKTLFGIASNSKAFTSAALAMLVEEGKLKWDDPVINHLPDFQMADPYVTREMTIRDLLVHRSGLGLGAGDLMYFPTTDLSRDEIVRRLRYVKLASSFRSRYAYDNILYIVAGQVIARVSGLSWDQFLQTRIFQPLGMVSTNTSVKKFRPTDEVAYPHAKSDGKLVPLEPEDSDNWGAAAGINSNLEDLSKWVLLQLGRGESNGVKLFSPAQSREMWNPVTILGTGRAPAGPLADVAPNFATYALGWNVSDYRGRKVVHHTGGLAGMVTRITLIPSMNLAVVVLTNQETGSAFNAITYTVLDHYMGAAGTDWVQVLADAQKKRETEATAAVAKAASTRNAESKPSLPLASYAGRYRDAWYGDIFIEQQNGKLRIRFSHSAELTGTLEHFQYDTFVTRWDKRSLLADAYVTFALQPDGSIGEVKMKAVSALTDFSFDFHDLLLKPVAKDAKPY